MASDPQTMQRMTNTILLLASGPDSRAELRLTRAYRDIRREIRLAKLGHTLRVEHEYQVQASELAALVMRHDPTVVHFSGHGTDQGELVFTTPDGRPQIADAVVIANVFETLRGRVRCVVLNACYSQVQAALIAQHVDVVVGMRSEVDDDSARVFATAFYQALAYGRSVADAFELARANIGLHQLPAESVPVLHVRRGVDPASIKLLYDAQQPPSGEPPSIASRSTRRRKIGGGVALLSVAVLGSVSLNPLYGEEQPLRRAVGQTSDETIVAFHADAHYARGRLVEHLDVTKAGQFYGRACEAGSALGCQMLAGHAFVGIGGSTRDLPRFKRLAEQSCSLGSPLGCNEVAAAHAHGLGIEEDDARAARLRRAACDTGQMTACVSLGWQHFTGEGVPRSVQTGLQLFRLAAARNEEDGLVSLGLVYSSGQGVEPDAERALSYYRQACDAGNLSGCESLALALSVGRGVLENDEEANAWLGELCDEWGYRGCTYLAFQYLFGPRVDTNRARELLRRGIAHGEQVAFGGLAFQLMYEQSGSDDTIQQEINQLLQQGCERLDDFACTMLGDRYASGWALTEDPQRANALYRSSCDNGYWLACVKLGRNLASGRGVETPDKQAAHELYLLAKQMGERTALTALADEYVEGVVVAKSDEKANQLYDKACRDKDERKACVKLRARYQASKDPRAEAAARRGCALDDFYECNMQGLLVEDQLEATRLYEKACAGNLAIACQNAGYQYHTGRGVAEDRDQAAYFYEKACDKGVMTGCNYLGVVSTREPAYRRKLFEKACFGDVGVACSNLARRYNNGEGVPKDGERAYQYYTMGCNLDHMPACNMKAMKMSDDVEATKLFEKACEANVSVGCFNTAFNHEHGEGVTADPIVAFGYYEKACSLGYDSGCEAVKRLRSEGVGSGG